MDTLLDNDLKYIEHYIVLKYFCYHCGRNVFDVPRHLNDEHTIYRSAKFESADSVETTIERWQ